mmetsp:Transcript_31467/g.57143  ORF Transcript_31467/g.57143 Transcript_31467/m.57143 type:complete len:210 (+) Transcript_31467:427-1056(+)
MELLEAMRTHVRLLPKLLWSWKCLLPVSSRWPTRMPPREVVARHPHAHLRPDPLHGCGPPISSHPWRRPCPYRACNRKYHDIVSHDFPGECKGHLVLELSCWQRRMVRSCHLSGQPALPAKDKMEPGNYPWWCLDSADGEHGQDVHNASDLQRWSLWTVLYRSRWRPWHCRCCRGWLQLHALESRRWQRVHHLELGPDCVEEALPMHRT